MKTTIVDSRASAVLYRFLYSRPGKKKKVILPVNICDIVPAIILKSGFQIEFVDIDSFDLCPDENHIFHVLENRPDEISGILYNYTYGIELDKTLFFAQLKQQFPNIWVVQDKCSNVPVPEIACPNTDLTLFSTGYAKHVDIGFGGFGIFGSDFEETHSMSDTFDIQTDSKRYRVSTHSAKMAPEEYFNLVKHKAADVGIHKDRLNEIYADHLPGEIQMGDEYNTWRFNILVDKKETILKELFHQNLFASSHFKPMSHDRAAFKNAYDLHDKVINLFNDFYYTEDQAFQTCKIIKEIL
jgi:hypothetical protein